MELAFFTLKVLGWALQPSSLLALVLITACVLQLRRKRGKAGRLFVFATVFYIIAGYSPAANWLLIPLEAAYEKVSLQDVKSSDGIIVLGGAVETIVSSYRWEPQLNEAAERMSETVHLAQNFPSLRIIFSGGKGEMLYSDVSETDVARQFFENQGIASTRISFENQSRNTKENAFYTAQLLKPRSQQKWVLVTSAFHMARAKALFEAQGFTVLPWPVDYRTRAEADVWRFFPQASEGLRRVDLAAREWMSVLLNYVRGDIPWPLPSSTAKLKVSEL